MILEQAQSPVVLTANKAVVINRHKSKVKPKSVAKSIRYEMEIDEGWSANQHPRVGAQVVLIRIQ